MRRSEEESRPYYISPTVKHSQSIMVWCCIAAHGIGSLELINGMINGTKYINMIEKRMLSFACVPCFLMITGFFKMTIRHSIASNKSSTGTGPIKLKR